MGRWAAMDSAGDTDQIRRLLRGMIANFEPLDLIPQHIEHFPHPATEAHMLAAMLRRGATADELRDLIRISPRQAAFLRKLTSGDVLKARTVERMIAFRTDVLKHFEAELANPIGAGLNSKTLQCDGDHGDSPCADPECWNRE